MNSRVSKTLAAIAVLSLTSYARSATADSKVLTTDNGMTVYTFDKDTNGKSHCYGQCAALWPMVRPDQVSGADISVTLRDDATEQASFKGKPIYLFAADQKPGDMYGDNVQGVWHVVPLSGKKAAAKSRSPGSASSGARRLPSIALRSARCSC